MEWLNQIGRRLMTLIRRREFDRDLDEEMRLRRDLREQEHIERGLSPKEAHYAAQRRFGNDLVLREGSRDATPERRCRSELDRGGGQAYGFRAEIELKSEILAKKCWSGSTRI